VPTPQVAQRVSHTHLAFTLALHRALRGAACWSPYSVASALGLAATGARGATRDELTALLLGIHGHDELAEHSALLSDAGALDPADGRGPLIGVANTLWARPDLPIRPQFTAELDRWPNGRVRSAPFGTDIEAARKQINADIADTTHGLIPELLGPGTITAQTIATLVNALYLKVAWRNRFAEGATTDRAFHAPAGPVQVPTMRLSGKDLGYTATDGWQVVVLPGAGDVEAVVLLPDATHDLATAEAALDADTLAALLRGSPLVPVDLYLPRFRVRARADLTSALVGLGVRTMFTDQADFGGIVAEPMAVEGVRHEAVLTVDEQGLEGAAATAMVFRALSMRMPVAEPIVVRVDRPFLFVVRHRPTGAIYFLARVTRP